MSKTEEYEYVRATITDGICMLRYQVKGLPVEGRNQHDESVSGWSDDDIKQLAWALIGARPEEVEVIWD